MLTTIIHVAYLVVAAGYLVHLWWRERAFARGYRTALDHVDHLTRWEKRATTDAIDILRKEIRKEGG